MPTPFENFVNTELPKRIGTNESPITPQAGDIPVFTGVGLLTESKTAEEAGLATANDLSNKQETLVSGTNIKTINGSTLLGNGDLTIATSTNLTTTQTSTDVTVLSDTGTDATIVLADGTNAGVSLNNYTSAERTKLAGISGTNTGDETTASIKTKLGVANTSTDGYLTSTDWTTFNNKQAALSDVITADTYGSSTQYPVITFNAKGIATGVTLQTVQLPALTEANFAVQKTGSPSITASWVLTALTTSRTHTYPNADINFGDLSFIASTNSNTLSGTRTHIVGGSSNTVSGTDVVLVNTSNSYFTSCTNVQANNVWWVGQAANPPSKNRISYIGSSFSQPVAGLSNLYSAALGSVQCLYTDAVGANGTSYNCTLDGDNTLGATNCAPVVIAGTLGAAVHDIEFIVAIGTGNPLIPVRHLIAKRRVYAQLKAGSVGSSSTVTIDTDTFVGDAATGSTSVGVTVDFTNNRLVPTITGTYGLDQGLMQASVRITSHFNRK